MMIKKNNLKWVVLTFGAMVTMGVSMPSCPGQQAMQQQIDALTQSNADLTNKVRGLEQKAQQTTTEMGQIKNILAGMAGTIKAMEAAQAQAAQAAAARPAPKAAPKAKAPAKKRR